MNITLIDSLFKFIKVWIKHFLMNFLLVRSFYNDYSTTFPPQSHSWKQSILNYFLMKYIFLSQIHVDNK